MRSLASVFTMRATRRSNTAILDDRAEVELAGGLHELVGDRGGHGVSGHESDDVISVELFR